MEKRVGSQKQLDFRSFFVIGIALFTVGLATKNITFGAAGLGMSVLGLVNRYKWQEKNSARAQMMVK